MKAILPITTVEELYNSHDKETGEIIVDATVWAIAHSTTREAIEIANMVGAERRKLSSALELLVGMPLKEMIDEWRMLQARDLCLDESIKLEEVATQCGFASYKGFTQAVLRRWATTPYAIRTGRVKPNGNYRLNRIPNQRQKAEESAQKLRLQQACTAQQQEVNTTR